MAAPSRQWRTVAISRKCLAILIMIGQALSEEIVMPRNALEADGIGMFEGSSNPEESLFKSFEGAFGQLLDPLK